MKPQEVPKPTKHELEQELQVLLNLRAGIVADRDQCDARIASQQERITEAQAKIVDYEKRFMSAPERLEAINARIKRHEDAIESWVSEKREAKVKVTRKLLDQMVIGALGCTNKPVFERGKKLLKGIQLKLPLEALYEEFKDLRHFAAKRQEK